MDAAELRRHFESLDGALEHQTTLHVRGGAAVVALGLDLRATVDIDVLPSSQFIDADLRQACERAGLGFNPPDKDHVERDYLEVVPAGTLVLPHPSPDLPYNTVFRGLRLTVMTPPAADLVVGKLKRLDPEDLADIGFLLHRFGLGRADLEEAFARLPARFQRDPVLLDNLRYVLEDFA